MKYSDRALGMNRPITRRDFVQGVGALGATAALAGSLSSCDVTPPHEASIYPPAFTGMRGNHDGSFAVAHALGREGKTNWGPVQQVDTLYDLVVVGAGISGLAAACFYRKEKPDARILLLDNHDDFGGHAKRNEFEVNGRMLLVEGGSQYVASPYSYSDLVKSLLHELGVDFSRLVKAADTNFNARHGLSSGYHFYKATWGKAVTVASSHFSRGSRQQNPEMTIEKTVNQFPVSEKAKTELLHLYTIEEDKLPDLSQEEKVAYFKTISYRDFLIKYIGVTEQDVFDFLQDQTRDIGLGIEATDAYLAMTYAGMPGYAATGITTVESDLTGFHMFPDGNASLTRLMVRSLIPEVAPGSSMEDIITARFDYAKLDQSVSEIRLRLNSTVIDASNNPDGKTVNVSYVQGDKTFRVSAKKCVLACNNSMIPYLCPELPQAQKQALSNQVKSPILFTRVAIKNWRAWKEMGLNRVITSGGYHSAVTLQAALSLGDYICPQEPDEPIVVCMYKFPHVNNKGLSAQEQFRMGRHELLTTPFEEIERHIRSELNELLGPYGFDAAEDIEAIIVNRWAHGYAYERGFHSLFDQDYDDPDDERYLHVQGRKPFGNITIANSDAGATAMLESAIDQAHRAVSELHTG